jgi:hypothetical protein
MSIEEFQPILTKLKLLLDNLPTELPLRSGSETIYAIFSNFSLNPALREDTGCEVSALSKQLKRVFGWQARSTGDKIIDIVEQGPGIYAIHGVFSNLTREARMDDVLDMVAEETVEAAFADF